MLLVVIVSTISFCQSVKFFTTARQLKDSIEKEYYINGAEHYSYFSDMWQIYIDSALAIIPDDDFLWSEKAMPYFKCRKYEVGLTYLDNAVLLNPKQQLDYRAFIKCVFCKTYKDAIIDFKNAGKLNGNFTTKEHPYSFYIGLSYLSLNQFDSAKTYFDSTVATETLIAGPSTIHFMDWFYLGITCYEKKDYQQAINYFDKALTRYNHFSEAEFYKAICLHKLHTNKDTVDRLFDEAYADFKKGYSFTEDNCVYEKYPYQLSEYILQYHGRSM